MNRTERELYEECVGQWGVPAQMCQVMEECGELIAAVNHALRGRGSRAAVLAEAADVSIMLDQLRFMLDCGDAEFESMRQERLNRVASRLNPPVKAGE